MKKRKGVLKHQFVEFIPEIIDEMTVYVSIPYSTAVHLCCCGCGRKVVTPISRRDWRLTFCGDAISLHPSIGNWNYPCKSHYWIKRNKVKWAISRFRGAVQPFAKSRCQPPQSIQKDAQAVNDVTAQSPQKISNGFWQWLRQMFDPRK